MGLKLPIDDRRKVMELIRYLNLTLYEFRRKFGITANVFEDVLLNKSRIPLRPKIKIIKAHPEISNVWLEFGTGDMTAGLIPNANLRRLFMKLTGLTELDELIDSKFIRYLCRECRMDVHEMTMILKDNSQISFPQARRIGHELGINPYKILAMYESDLECNKKAVKEFMKDLNRFKDKRTKSKYDPREKKGNSGEVSPIYLYLKGKVDDKYLTPTALNRVLGTRAGRNILYSNKTISKSTALVMCEKFNLDFSDMKSAGIIQNYEASLNGLDSEFYRLIKDKIDTTESLSCLSSKIGILHNTFLDHIKGKFKMSARSALKYYKYFRIDFSSVVVDNEKSCYQSKVDKLTLQEYFKASQKALKP